MMAESSKTEGERITRGRAITRALAVKTRKKLLYVLTILAVSGVLVYLETKLTFFRKFMPVLDNKFYIALTNIYFLVIVLLLFLATRIILKTYIEKRRGIWGSGLKTKLTLTVFSVSVISSATLFILTSWFFYMSMDKWFSQKIEDTVESARELSEFYYEDLFSRYEKMGKQMADTIRQKNILEKEKELSWFVEREGKSNFLGYLAVLDLAGQPIETYSALDKQMDQILAGKARAFSKNREARQIVPLPDGDLLMLLSPVTDETGRPKALLFLGEKVRVRGTQRMKQISSAYSEFIKDARPFKKILKYSLLSPLLLVTMLSIFFSTWIGIKMATEITIPLEKVKEGAAIIAKGRFDINLEERGKDEIGTLVSAFNGMARELKIAKDEVEEKRKYIEVILDNVATGIISTDAKGNVLLLNRAAKDILRVRTDDWVGIPLKTIIGQDFRKVIRLFLASLREDPTGSMAREMTLSLQNDAIHLRTSLTVLRDEAGRPEGYIGTFDDITHIMRAEKLATWREIAKRLTHEIKNPLTPIKLSAERLRRRLLPKAQGKEREVLEETTSIILAASDDITAMVNELTKLTQTSSVRTTESINGIVEETVSTYRNLYPNITFQTEAGNVPQFSMDRDQMKRALINLVTNSINAIDSAEGTIRIATRNDKNRGVVRIEVADTGPGIKDEDKVRVFDPYFTRNPNGTGLGLAIVNSVILGHGGRINVEDNKPQGAKMVIELPVLEA
jgi:two-component system, NtrC family, nitrogen regulation sensor histidine kinase NtrY